MDRMSSEKLRHAALRLLPFGERAILVMEAEVTAGEPPFDGSAEGRSPAPAVWIATALPVPRIVDSAKEAARHVQSVTRGSLRRPSRRQPRKRTTNQPFTLSQRTCVGPSCTYV